MYTAKESIKRTMILFAVICCVASVISAVLFVYSNFSTNILSANTLNDFSSGWTYNKDGESVSAAINSSYYGQRGQARQAARQPVCPAGQKI